MILNNGHSNGHSKDLPQNGVGDSALLADLQDDHRKRGTYVMLERALKSAMDVPEATMRAAAMSAIKDIGHDDGRIRARARDFLLKLQDSGVAAAIGLDKILRLDEGRPTENVANVTMRLEFDTRE